jgi:hypothetical protein
VNDYESTTDLLIERNRDLLKRGAVLVDETDLGQEVRTLVYLEHAIQDARTDRTGNRRVVSKQMQFVEIDNQRNTTAAGYAPYLNYRPLSEDEQGLFIPTRSASEGTPISTRSASEGAEARAGASGWYPFEPAWLREELESKVLEYAALNLVPSHLDEVRRHKETLVDKTKAAVQERLSKEINYWDHRAVQLKEQELAGKVNAKINSGKARQRADELAARLQKRLVELDQERRVSPLPPVVLGAALVVPLGLLARLRGGTTATPPDFAADTKRSELLAMCAVMDTERRLGFIPRDVSAQKLGYDVESSIPNTGKLRFIEVKGRIAGARTVTITSGEIRTALNKPDDFILAIVEIDGEVTTPKYIRRPFQREPDFGVTSVNYDLAELRERGEEPK